MGNPKDYTQDPDWKKEVVALNLFAVLRVLRRADWNEGSLARAAGLDNLRLLYQWKDGNGVYNEQVARNVAIELNMDVQKLLVDYDEELANDGRRERAIAQILGVNHESEESDQAAE